jgi:putative endonuclease
MGPCAPQASEATPFFERLWTTFMSRTYWIYILASRPHGTLYIGVTNSLAQRMDQHRSGGGSKFVKQYAVDRLVYVEPYQNPQDAIRREKQLKAWKREWKIELIETDNRDWSDLSALIIE